MNVNHLFCFGLGYTAQNLAKELLNQKWHISGTCRSREELERLKVLRIFPYLFDSELPLENITHILISVPPADGGDIVIRRYLKDIRKIKNLKWIGYLSTTGVYGDHKGGWIDENTPVNPSNERSKWRADAEREWLSTGLPAHIFRLSGIYGNGRSAIDAVKNGTAKRIHKEGQIFSRIHVDDISQILQASINKPNPGSIYNCADDKPSSQEEVVSYAAELMGVEPPALISFEKADLSPMARSFYSCSRKVSNQKIKDELGVRLKYPDYILGLRMLYKL